MTVPQKHGPPLPSKTIGADEDILNLGFTDDLRHKGTDQVKAITEKAKEWSSRMNTNKYLTPTDICLSLDIQLKPKVIWSISCLSANPKDLDEELHRVYQNTMSRMNINCKMKKEMRTIPLQYCGLGYFDLNIECLGKRFHIISRHLDAPMNVGRIMRQSFETFQLSLG